MAWKFGNNMKLNIGSGFKRFDGFLNIDDDHGVNPDYVVDLEHAKFPIDDNIVDEIKAHHILEHIGEGFIPLMKELYRICKHGAILDIIVPHYTHTMFHDDPTHKRAITIGGMSLFSKKYCKDHVERWGSSNGIALKYDIDFEIITSKFTYDPFYEGMLDDFFKRKEKNKVSAEEDFMIQRLLREGNNVAATLDLKMIAVKE